MHMDLWEILALKGSSQIKIMVQCLLGPTTAMEMVVLDLHKVEITQVMAEVNLLVTGRIMEIGILGLVILKQGQTLSQSVRFILKGVILL